MLLNLTRFIVLLLTVALCVVAVSLTTVFLQTYREYQTFKAREAEYAAELVQVRREFEVKEEYLRLVLQDPDFLERVVREKLGYIHPEEMIFHFDP